MSSTDPVPVLELLRRGVFRVNSKNDLVEGIVEGAALRVRPIAMTVAVIIAGLLPIMWGSGTYQSRP
jgi:Cu/Ag efflux pump CusA